ncbi:hypothetical protein ACHAXT_006157 [Thalassiosira profunda]
MSTTTAILVETVNSSTHAGASAGPSKDPTAAPQLQHSPGAATLDYSLPLHPPHSQSLTVYQPPPTPTPTPIPSTPRTIHPQLICTISAGFEKGDYLIREERGSNVYFDFFEEAYNFATQKGYSRMPLAEENEYMEIVRLAHKSIPGGCRFNTGRLLLVMRKRLVPVRVTDEEDESMNEVSEESASSGSSTSKMQKKLRSSDSTPPTDMESSSEGSGSGSGTGRHMKSYSTNSTSYVDSWE